MSRYDENLPRPKWPRLSTPLNRGRVLGPAGLTPVLNVIHKQNMFRRSFDAGKDISTLAICSAKAGESTAVGSQTMPLYNDTHTPSEPTTNLPNMTELPDGVLTASRAVTRVVVETMSTSMRDIIRPVFPETRYVSSGTQLLDGVPDAVRVEYFSLHDLLQLEFYLPEYIEEYKYFTSSFVLVPKHEVEARQMFHSNYGSASRPVVLAHHLRHLQYVRSLGRSLVSAYCSPNFNIRLGCQPQIIYDVSTKYDAGMKKLVRLTSADFVESLRTYLEGLARSVYVFCRLGFLHSEPATFSRISDLDKQLDTLLTDMLVHEPFVQAVGFVCDPLPVSK